MLVLKEKVATIIKGKNYTRIGLYKCDCGKSYCNDMSEVNRGRVVGCYDCRNRITNLTHAHSKDGSGSAYISWKNMRQRCNNPNHTSYSDYGGRGISICDRWNSFENFLLDMGDRPKSMSIDRINVNGNYEPNNCQWATAKEQRNNQRG